MDNSGDFDIPDSTDWLHTPLASFEPLEAALRCQVCKDFYDTPMLTTCSHTFCSLCIRRCFAADGKCPTCRTSDQANKLRRNWAVQEIVDAFQAARAAALKLAREAAEVGAEVEAGRRTGGKKRKLDEADLEGREPKGRSRVRRTRSRGRRVDEASSPPELVDLEEGGEDAEYRPDDGLVKCPICSRRMKEEAVYPHLDQCDGEPKLTSGRSTRSRFVHC
jgi:E3 ubiquitin-protein ligase RAD18